MARDPSGEPLDLLTAPMERYRLDKWLWAARFYKTRALAAEDIAKGIVFLASDDAAFMTGSGLVVDGGYTAQ